MRLLAEILFWIGRLEIVALAIVVVHAVIVWRWRFGHLKQRLALGWFLLFLAFSAVLFPSVLEKATDGVGYVTAHLYGHIWRTDEEVLSNILLRWRNIWLPIYTFWLGMWLAGIGSIWLLSKVKRRFAPKANV